MVRARCPDCDELVEITPNGADPRLTNLRQRLVMHPDKRQQPPQVCDGSGKDV